MTAATVAAGSTKQLFRLVNATTDSLQQSCVSQLTSSDPCDCTQCTLYGSRWLADSCCGHKGVAASILAFERSEKWGTRLDEFNRCTGAKVTLAYNGMDGEGDESAMPMDIQHDLGSTASSTGALGVEEGANIFDGYIAQVRLRSRWLSDVDACMHAVLGGRCSRQGGR